MILQRVKELEVKNHFVHWGAGADNSMNLYMRGRGAGADNPNGVNFEHHRNICCKFQKDCFELCFYIEFS